MQNRIRELRKQRGMTMRELGRVFNVAEGTISQYETGKRQPNNEMLLRLGEFFEVSVDYLLGKSHEPWPSKLFDGVGSLDLPNFSFAPEFDANTKKLLSLSSEMTDEEKRQLLLAARLIIEQRSEK